MSDHTKIRIALIQTNTIVGDLEGNRKKIENALESVQKMDCDIITFPELTITGYPPEDLLMRRHFLEEQRDTLNKIADDIVDQVVIIGFVDYQGADLFNSAAVMTKRTIQGIYHKIQLPNYSVFDEERYFVKGHAPLNIQLGEIRIGISICEDIWIERAVTESLALNGGAEIVINISASPYAKGKEYERIQLVQRHAKYTYAYMLYNNLVGGQDELVFDGRSLIVDPTGKILVQGNAFEEDVIIADINVQTVRELRKSKTFEKRKEYLKSDLFHCDLVSVDYEPSKTKEAPIPLRSYDPQSSQHASVYKAILLGLSDYVKKNGFKEVVFGLSGGIDSALVAALAADALGSEHVHGVTMPTRFSSSGSVEDSISLANNLQIDLRSVAIEDVFQSFLELLKPIFGDLEFDITEENIQSRIRGIIVMALSNKFGWLPLATGNKSEVSVGYCTIYGDMVGGFAPLKDVTKTMVYQLSEYRNRLAGFDLIPKAVIDKAPSAELRPDQKDQDSLPPYDILDQILELYIEKNTSVTDIVALGYDNDTVRNVARLVDINEYKRRQSAPGVKITSLAFGKDRRMPITSSFKGR